MKPCEPPMFSSSPQLLITKHARERLQQRSISEYALSQVIAAPDKKLSEGNSTKFIRTYQGRKYHVVAQWKASEQKWLVISAWVRGEDDSEPLSVTLLLAPFRILWWLIKKLLLSITKHLL